MLRSLTVGAATLSLLGTLYTGDPLAAAARYPGASAGSDPVREIVGPPTNERITVEIVTANGSGCPPGSTKVAVISDNTAFTLTYRDYVARVGRGAGPTDARKNCQLAVHVRVPSGYTYAVVKADYRGYAYLAAGATGVETASYYFQGMTDTRRRSHSFVGPLDDSWQTTDETDIDAVSWAPCGEPRYLNINTQLRIDAGTSDPANNPSHFSMHSTDTAISTKYQFAWATCPA